MYVINDLHLGVKRVAGTTAESALRLRQHLLEQCEALLNEIGDAPVAINGDFFDTYNVPLSDLLEAFTILAGWLDKGGKRVLHGVWGNHDLSKSSAEMGSFQVMLALLQARYQQRVQSVGGAGWLDEARGIYAISHVVNQAEFDLQIERVPVEARALLLHCNFDSPFAEHADHSLNLSREQAKRLTSLGTRILLGHEHHPSSFFSGAVLVPGNQFPSSVADCVTPNGRVIETKSYVRITETCEFEQIPFWRASDEDGFIDIPWRELEGDVLRDAEARKGFIRISGEAQPEEAADALRRISKLRQKSQAFVVANAVRVAGRADSTDGVADSIEDVRKTDVIQLVLDTLTPEQAKVVSEIWSKRER